MGKVKTGWVRTRDAMDEHVEYKYQISVSVHGKFYCKPDQHFIDTADSMEADLKAHDAYIVKGTLYSARLSNLEEAMARIVKRYYEKDKIKKELVIIYKIQNQVSYYKRDGSISPNGERGPADARGEWLGDTPKFRGDKWDSYCVKICAQIWVKSTKENTGKVKYDGPQKGELGEHGNNLNKFLQLNPFYDGDYGSSDYETLSVQYKEMAYTEERAKFFYDILIAMCKLADKVSVLKDEDKLLQIINSGTKLLE